MMMSLRRRQIARVLLLGSGCASFLAPRLAAANTPRFNPGFVFQAGALDSREALAALTPNAGVSPGRYQVAVRINREPFGNHDIAFDKNDEGRLMPCLTLTMLESMGVRVDGLGPAAEATGDKACVELARLIPGATTTLDAANLALEVSVPQIAMRRKGTRGIERDQWNPGITAAFANYQVSAQQGHNRHQGTTRRHDLYLSGGANFGAWRLRTQQALRENPYGKREWQSAYTYLQRDVPGFDARLTLGESFTQGDLFRSVPVTGALVTSAGDMLPDGQLSYAPVVRGHANSRARLEVLQNGYPIYATYVSAGPYEITDINISGGDGELEVVLTEDDGQVRRYTQPYATLANLLRGGTWRYGAVLGRYNGAATSVAPMVWQGTAATGVGWGSTVFGGVMASDFYRALNLGFAKDLGALGAASFDVTTSAAQVDTPQQDRTQGQSYSLRYGKAFASRTQLRFAGYRYSTEGYRDFEEAIRERERDSRFHGGRRSRLEASVYQYLPGGSSVNLTFSQEDYWQQDQSRKQFQLGYNTRVADVSLSLYGMQTLDQYNCTDRQFGLTASLPLDFGHRNSATLDIRSSNGRTSQQAALIGSLDENRLSYRLAGTHEAQGAQTASASLAYNGRLANLGAGYTEGGDFRSFSVNAGGAAVWHADGVTLGSYLGETAGLVHVPGVEGLGLENAPGALTDARGYALVPYLRAYRANAVTLDTRDLGPGIELANGTAQVVPTHGAIVKTTFDARRVSRILLTVRNLEGQPLPFATRVLDGTGTPLGMLAQAGQALLATHAQPQNLHFRWGPGDDQRCEGAIAPAHMEAVDGFLRADLTCS